MAPDLRPCCQQALLDHWAVCDARREDPPTGVLSASCSCGHVEVLHAIRGNGSRGACSISTGKQATSCGCKAYEAARLSAAAVQDSPEAHLRVGRHVGPVTAEVPDA